MIRHFIKQVKARCSSSDALNGLLLSSLLINVLALMMPLVMLQTYDRIIPNQSVGTLMMLIIAVAITLTFEIILKVIRSVISSWSESRYEHLTAMHAFNHIMRTNPQSLARAGGGKLLDDMNAISSLKEFYTGQLLTTLVDLPFVVVFLALMTYLAGWLVLIPIFIIMIYYQFVFKATKALKQETEERHVTDDKRTNFVIQVLSKIHTIKSMSMEQLILRRYERLQEQTAAIDHALSVHSGGKTAISQFASQITVVTTVSTGAFLVINNSLSVGALAACIFLANRVLQPVSRLTGLLTRLQSVRIAEERLEVILNYPREAEQGSVPTSAVNGELSLQNVTFAYEGEAPLLSGISCEIKAGECVGIAGDSLSGKSTLLKLMQGMLTPTSGQVLSGGQSVSSYLPDEYRQKVAYIDQSAVIYEGSFMDNLTMFREGDTVLKAKTLASAIGLDSYIMRLPDGYDTVLGNTSADTLPRGIRQRIAIVRALVMEPKIILFDEANTALDLQADRALYQLLAQLKGRVTIVLVSLRPSFLVLADRKLHLNNGVLDEHN